MTRSLSLTRGAASDAFCETTIGYTDDANGALFKLAYDDPALKVGTVKDTVGVELCGALKNIVAIGAGAWSIRSAPRTCSAAGVGVVVLTAPLLCARPHLTPPR